MEEKKQINLSWFYKWFLDNKATSVLLILLLLFLNFFLLYKIDFIFRPVIDFLSIILLPIVLAGLFFYILNPIVDYAEKKKVPRTASICLLFVFVIILIIWGLAVVVPSITKASENFIKNFPDYISSAEELADRLIEEYNLTGLNINIDTVINDIGAQALSFVKNFYSTLVLGVGGFITAATGIVIDIIIFPFILFYLLRDGKNIGTYLTGFLPTAWRKDSLDLLVRINNQLSSFIRGEVIVALSAAAMFSIGLSIIRLPYALTIAFIAGVFNLIPYLGSFLAFALSITVGIIVDPWMVVQVIIVFIIEQTIEGRFIQPLVIGSQMEIHPITILFILLTSASFFGVWGVFLGIPVYAVAKVVISHIYLWYRSRSSLFAEEQVAEEALEE